MTREETKKALHIIAEMYQQFQVTTAKVDIWHRILADYPAAAVNNAIAAFISTDIKGYAPVPGQLIELMAVNDDTTEGEAWDMVTKALRNGIYGFEEEFEKLPELVQKCVGSAAMIQTWASMPSSEIHTVVKSQFLRDYRTQKERKKQDAKIPAPILEVLRKNNLLEAK